MDTNIQQEGVGDVELLQTLDTRSREVAYEKCLRRSEDVIHDEKARQLRLQILLLEDQNNDLHAQSSTDDECIEELMNYSKEVETQLEVAGDNLKSAQNDMRVKSREIETLKAELVSLQGVTMDSTKLLTEKLTLARELSTLRPEIENLRSQAASHQSLLAEKLSLQRQLSTCQVELETEKRSYQRALAKEGRLQEQDSLYESKLEELQVEVGKERRERQKLEREVQRTTTEWENQKATLESRVDAFTNKLRLAKDQLKEERTKKQNVHAAAQATAGSGETAARDHRKRNAAQMDSDTMIGTPGLLPASKRGKRGSTLPGDKSTFSITPFLNRTTSVAPDSTIEEPSNGGEDEELQKPYYSLNGLQNTKGSLSTVDSHKIQTVNDASTDAPMPESGLTAKVKYGKTNAGVLPTRKKPQSAPSLEQVAEENDEQSGTVAIAQPKVPGNTIPDDIVSDDVEVKKRKRKILGGPGRTLFDEDDGEAPKGDRGLLGDARKSGTLGRLTLGGPKLGARVRLGPARGGSSTFSPLKKERKAAFSNF